MAKKDIAQKDYELYQTYRDDTQEWRIQRDKNKKFYFNEQWSQSEGAKKEAEGESDIVVNKIRSLLRMRVSMMVANKPMGRVLGVHKEDIDSATLLEEFADWHLYNSDYQVKLERIVMGQQQVGLHYFSIYDDPIADYNRGELKIGEEPYSHVFVDKAAGREWDFGDAPRMIVSIQRRPEDWYESLPPAIKKRIPRDDVQDLMVPDDEVRWYGESQHREMRDIGSPYSITPTGEGVDKASWIREADVYERTLVDVPVALSADGILYAVADPDGEFPPLVQEQLAEGTLTEQTITQPRIKWRKNISGKILLPLDDTGKTEDILPIDKYPLVPVVDEDTGNSMPFGEIDFQKGIQEVYNTAISLTLLNASLASNMKMLVDSGKAQMPDIEQFKDEWAVPGAIINMATDPVTGKFPVEIVRPEPISQAWFLMAQALAKEIEFQISTFSLRTGDPTDAPETFAATMQLGQWAQDILRIPLSRLELAFERVYNLLFTWSPTYYPYEKLFYTFGKDGAPIYQTINFSRMEFFKARYRIRAGSTLPSQTVSELGIMQNLAQIQPALIGSVIDRMPGLRDADKKEIKQSIDVITQLQQQNGQLEETVQVLQTQLQHLNEQNMSLQREQALQPYKEAVNKEIAKIQANAKAFGKLNDKQKKSERK
jgi:FtsZ-binding cell division protein ZapB